MDARAIDIMHELARTNTALQITIEERDAVCREAQEWRTAATMRRAEADELRNTLAQLRERQAEYENFIDAEGAKTLKIAMEERDALRTLVGDLRVEVDTARRFARDAGKERDALRAALVSLVDGKSEFDIVYDTGMDAGEARKIMDLAYNR